MTGQFLKDDNVVEPLKSVKSSSFIELCGFCLIILINFNSFVIRIRYFLYCSYSMVAGEEKSELKKE